MSGTGSEQEDAIAFVLSHTMIAYNIIPDLLVRADIRIKVKEDE